jgi:hypothetical protein
MINRLKESLSTIAKEACTITAVMQFHVKALLATAEAEEATDEENVLGPVGEGVFPATNILLTYGNFFNQPPKKVVKLVRKRKIPDSVKDPVVSSEEEEEVKEVLSFKIECIFIEDVYY